jgi:hypothetical protein
MLLKERSYRSVNPAPSSNRLWRFGKRTKIAAVILAIVTVAAALFAAGGFVGVSAERQQLVKKMLRVDVGATVRNTWTSLGASPEQIMIDIKHKDYEQLAAWRQQALERGQITSDLKESVPATIRYRDKQLKAKVRLKGEWTDHLAFNKWSFRINVSGEDTLFGMKSFSIQHPRTRSYIYEWIYHTALRREDIPAQRYQFIAVTVNGRHQGVFALEENFTKQLIESNQRREGVILRFNGDFRYQPFSHEPGVTQTTADTGIAAQESSNIQLYDEEKIAEDPNLHKQFLVAHNLLQAFRAGRLPTHKVFDADKLAMYFAVSELTGGTFAAYDWSDMRLLYNPVTSLLEPIGVEGNVNYEGTAKPICTDCFTPEDSFHRRLFDDEVFFRKYVAALEKVSDPAYVDALLADIGPELDQQMRIIHSEWPYWNYSPDTLYRNSASLRGYLNPHKGLHAYLIRGKGQRCELDLGAIQAMPIEVLSVSAGDVVLLPGSPLVLPGKVTGETVAYRSAVFATYSGASLSEEWQKTLKVQYRLLGTNTDRVAEVFPYPRLDETLLLADILRCDPNPEQFPFVQMDEQARTITFVAGQHRVDRNLILPAGYTVVAGPGVEIDLAVGAKVITYSPLRFAGTEEQPVVIQSLDGTGQGLTVLKAGAKSLLNYVTFRGLTNPDENGWTLTGAVTFYASPVELRHCEFLDNHSEDSLNIIRSEFLIDQSLFQNATSDAFDGDFVTGTVSRSSFVKIKGDCIDVSGSRVKLADIYVRECNDKGVSLGEASAGTGERIVVEKSRIGIAAKDLSEGVFTDVQITDTEMGLAVFQKKPEYGGGRLEVTQLNLDRVKTPYVIETGSTMIVENRQLPPKDAEVKKLLYGSAESTAAK